VTPTQQERILAARGKLALMIRSAHLVELRALADAALVVFEGELLYRLTDAGEEMAQVLAASNDQSQSSHRGQLKVRNPSKCVTR
jgi:hypothetical protein